MMRIERITLTHVRIPLVEPFRISNGEVAEKDGIVVALESGDYTGYGESSPMAGSFYSADTPESCWLQLTKELGPAIAGREFDSLDAASAWIDQQPGSNFAKVGLETALWDVEAQRRGLPLHRLLGAEKDHAESGLAVGLYDTTEQLLATIARYLPDGYRRVKIKVCPGHDVELVAAVRARFGDIPLMTDANASYTLADLPIYQQLEAYGLRMFEQPLAGGALEDSAQFQSQLKTPICLDESLESFADLERAAELGSFRIANIKIQRVGGFRNALKLYHRCRELGLSIWVGTMPELGIGQAQGAALSTLAGCDYPTDVEASDRWFRDDIIDPFLKVYDGRIAMPERTGLGYDIPEEKLERYRVAHCVIEP
ncbi:MAG TPA: o-succinylbenzoate synthase [Bryobacteraceae bacterium]|nr:o-succinylbenzoate synthase [Bryobacteraceae bacterium]